MCWAVKGFLEEQLMGIAKIKCMKKISGRYIECQYFDTVSINLEKLRCQSNGLAALVNASHEWAYNRNF